MRGDRPRSVVHELYRMGFGHGWSRMEVQSSSGVLTQGAAMGCDCKIKELRDLPCSLWLTGRVHEEECDESFSMFHLITKNCARFLIEKRMERREMIKREIATLEKTLEKVI